jgi:hypothetical protein
MTTTTIPHRIQRQRTAGWTAPLDDQGRKPIYVGRPSGWGNPFRIGEPYRFINQHGELLMGVVGSREYAAELFKQYLAVRTDLHQKIRDELGGRNLSCWCPLPEPGEGDHCHAAVLLQVARGARP